MGGNFRIPVVLFTGKCRRMYAKLRPLVSTVPFSLDMLFRHHSHMLRRKGWVCVRDEYLVSYFEWARTLGLLLCRLLLPGLSLDGVVAAVAEALPRSHRARGPVVPKDAKDFAREMTDLLLAPLVEGPSDTLTKDPLEKSLNKVPLEDIALRSCSDSEDSIL